MATSRPQVLGRALLTPAVALLFIWMIVPLAMTIYFSFAALQPAQSRTAESFVGLENFRLLPHRSRLSDRAAEHAGAGRLGAGDHHPRRHAARAAARPADDRAQHRAPDGDRAVLRDADRQRAGLEEPADASGLRPVRLASRRSSGCTPIDWFARCAACSRSS